MKKNATRYATKFRRTGVISKSEVVKLVLRLLAGGSVVVTFFCEQDT